MANVFDVAKYVLELCGGARMLPITTWKLQKLIYYAQAWAVVWDDEPLFGEEIQAWANGPVCPDLYRVHRGKLKISDLDVGNSGNLANNERETVEVVFEHYGKKTAQYLSELTHQKSRGRMPEVAYLLASVVTTSFPWRAWPNITAVSRVKPQLTMSRFNGLVNRIGGPTNAGELVLV